MTETDRPSIPSISKTENQTATETFQNESLRPIIKGLHGLIIAIFRNYLSEKKDFYFRQDEQNKPRYIHKVFKTDAKLKQQFRGMIIGHFSVDEFQAYLLNKSEINRRINSIILKRILDSMGEFEENG